MSSIRVLQILMKNGVISREQAYELNSQSEERRVLLGEILVKRGYLSMRQTLEVLKKQADGTGYFGEIAKELGYITDLELKEALSLQKEMSPHPLELLFESKIVEPEVLVPFLIKHIKALEHDIELISVRQAA